MIKILAACGAGVNSSHQIKSALEEELSNRGYDVQCDAVMVKDVNEKCVPVEEQLSNQVYYYSSTQDSIFLGGDSASRILS